MTTRRLATIAFLLAICLILGLQVNRVEAQASEGFAVITGRVVDVNGNPVSEASVIIIDWYRQRTLKILKTDREGYYWLEVEAGFPYSYRIYAYKEEDGSIIFAPSTFENTLFPLVGETMTLQDLRLVPGAALNITGEVWNIFTARYSTSMKAQVLDPSSGKILTCAVDPDVGDYTPFYGDNVTSFFVNPGWVSPFLSSSHWIVVVIPADKPVELRIIASQPGAADQVFTVRNGELPFKLPQGSMETVDITQSAYLWSLSAVEKTSETMWANIREAERFGFFLASLKDTAIREVDFKIGVARQNIERGNLTIDIQRRLREAYVFTTKFIISELNNLKTIAAEGAQILPLFLCLFSISLTFFITEKEKLRIRLPLFTLTFLLMTVCFYFLYPGMPLIFARFSNMFFISVGIAFFSGLLAILLLQKLIYESGNPTRVPLRSALAVAFTLGKRYVKLRKFSSLLVVISICMLISAATTLTSVTSIFGLNAETVAGSSGEWAFMKNPGERAGSFIPIDMITLLHVSNESNVKLVSPKMETLPTFSSSQYSMQLVARNRRVQILGIIGIIPDLDRKYVDLTLRGGKYVDEEDSLMVSYSTAQALQLTVGSNVTLRFSSGGFSFELPMRVSGIFDDEDFNNKKDLNNDPYAPTVLIEDNLLYCNASQIIIVSYQKALQLSSKPYSLPISISRMIVEFKNPDDREQVMDFVQSQAWAKGFHVWLSHDGQMIRYSLGTRVEIRFLDVVPPLVIVMMFITRIMYDVVERRRREIFVYTTLGFNPLHVALVFIAESATMGLLGGCFGYLTGLSVFRILKYVSEAANVGISENLHWEISVLSILLGVTLAVASAIPPSLKAARLAVPSFMRKIKLSPEEESKRYEEIYKAFGERVVFMPIRARREEALFLINFLYDRLNERAGGYSERVEDLGRIEEKQMPDRSESLSLEFRYVIKHRGRTFSTRNKARLERKTDDEWFRMYFHSTAEQEGMPELIRERVIRVVYNISMDWVRKKALTGPSTGI
ncbi:MAG: FtsX-like permease family protein [Thermoproteota archaeon]